MLQIGAAAEDFPVFAPLEYLSRIRLGDPRDPLLLQILPVLAENVVSDGFGTDPVGDLAVVTRPGILQKYEGRCLLVLTGACAVHCRYCFRRHFPYDLHPKGRAEWQSALNEIESDPTIEEVLFSGGDPLLLQDGILKEIVERLDSISHVSRIRIHTRLPIMIPQRVDEALLDWLGHGRATRIVVIHANHEREIDDSVIRALARMADAGIPVMNQAVLLRGVNDSVDALVGLSKALINARVMPYYLHQLDRVQGAAHFEVPIEQGIEMVKEMRKRLPGYAVPRYVIEEPGKPHKTVIA
jgi:EF-P beta-lysylation protein EpmB